MKDKNSQIENEGEGEGKKKKSSKKKSSKKGSRREGRAKEGSSLVAPGTTSPEGKNKSPEAKKNSSKKKSKKRSTKGKEGEDKKDSKKGKEGEDKKNSRKERKSVSFLFEDEGQEGQERDNKSTSKSTSALASPSSQQVPTTESESSTPLTKKTKSARSLSTPEQKNNAEIKDTPDQKKRTSPTQSQTPTRQSSVTVASSMGHRQNTEQQLSAGENNPGEQKAEQLENLAAYLAKFDPAENLYYGAPPKESIDGNFISGNWSQDEKAIYLAIRAYSCDLEYQAFHQEDPDEFVKNIATNPDEDQPYLPINRALRSVVDGELIARFTTRLSYTRYTVLLNSLWVGIDALYQRAAQYHQQHKLMSPASKPPAQPSPTAVSPVRVEINIQPEDLETFHPQVAEAKEDKYQNGLHELIAIKNALITEKNEITKLRNTYVKDSKSSEHDEDRVIYLTAITHLDELKQKFINLDREINFAEFLMGIRDDLKLIVREAAASFLNDSERDSKRNLIERQGELMRRFGEEKGKLYTCCIVRVEATDLDHAFQERRIVAENIILRPDIDKLSAANILESLRDTMMRCRDKSNRRYIGFLKDDKLASKTVFFIVQQIHTKLLLRTNDASINSAIQLLAVYAHNPLKHGQIQRVIDTIIVRIINALRLLDKTSNSSLEKRKTEKDTSLPKHRDSKVRIQNETATSLKENESVREKEQVQKSTEKNKIVRLNIIKLSAGIDPSKAQKNDESLVDSYEMVERDADRGGYELQSTSGSDPGTLVKRNREHEPRQKSSSHGGEIKETYHYYAEIRISTQQPKKSGLDEKKLRLEYRAWIDLEALFHRDAKHKLILKEFSGIDQAQLLQLQGGKEGDVPSTTPATSSTSATSSTPATSTTPTIQKRVAAGILEHYTEVATQALNNAMEQCRVAVKAMKNPRKSQFFKTHNQNSDEQCLMLEYKRRLEAILNLIYQWANPSDSSAAKNSNPDDFHFTLGYFGNAEIKIGQKLCKLPKEIANVFIQIRDNAWVCVDGAQGNGRSILLHHLYGIQLSKSIKVEQIKVITECLLTVVSSNCEGYEEGENHSVEGRKSSSSSLFSQKTPKKPSENVRCYLRLKALTQELYNQINPPAETNGETNAVNEDSSVFN